MKRYPRFNAPELPYTPPERSRYHIVPAPLERSTSYGKGTVAGPRALLDASLHLEAFDGVDVPGRAGIYTLPPVDCAGSTEAALRRIGRAVSAVAARGAIPVLLGGEHTVSVGAVRALRESGHRFGVVQFDAHGDLRDCYQGSRLSHGCVMRRIADMGVPIFQIGIRSLCMEEVELRRRLAIPHLDAERVVRQGIPARPLPRAFPETIYITFDVDALDPSVMPGTGTPEPGGLSWYDTMALLEKAIGGRRVIGFDVVELAPIRGFNASEYVAARLTYAIMGIINRKGGP
jgi:agmatinase